MTIHACPHCGVILTKPRSGPDHRRFFAAIHAAFTNWPESHEFTPRDPEHLRAYLLVQANHVDVAFLPAPEGCAENPALLALFRLAVEATGAALAKKAGYMDIRVCEGGVEIRTPRTINHSVVSQKEFGPIRDNVESLIEAAVGVTAQQLLKAEAA